MSNLVVIYPTKHCTEKASRARRTQNNFIAFFLKKSEANYIQMLQTSTDQ